MAATVPAQQVATADPAKQLKLEAVPVPPFDGTHRGYVIFRTFWDENMSNHTSSAQNAHLMKALPDRVKEGLSCVRKSAEDILLQLEDKYGKPEKAAQEVVDELHQMDYKKLGSKFMIDFSVKLETLRASFQPLVRRNGSPAGGPCEIWKTYCHQKNKQDGQRKWTLTLLTQDTKSSNSS